MFSRTTFLSAIPHGRRSRGVWAADPLRPPVPPTGSEAFEFVDADENIIGWGIIWPRHVRNPAVLECAYELLDALDPPSDPSAPVRRLRLV